MALVDVIRKVIPHKARITVGVWAINLVSHNWPLLKAYLTMLRGKPPENMGLIENYCYCDYDGRRIFAPKNAAGVFMEIFQDEVYEQVWKLNPGDVVLDIGAYVGMFTVKASRIVGEHGKVVAIEPSPENHAMLVGNCRGLDNTILVKKAVMVRGGVGKLYYSKSAAANSLVVRWKEYVKVETITLDDLMSELGLEKVDFIKVDAEGAELDVLKGAKRTLEKGTRLAIAAYHTAPNGEAEIGQVVEALHGVGYRVQSIKGLRSYIYAEKA